MVRPTPADRYSRRDRFGRPRGAGLTSAVPASTATAGSAVAGSSRDSGVRGSGGSGDRLSDHGGGGQSFGFRACTFRGGADGSFPSPPGRYGGLLGHVCGSVF